jgi:hypothetical protein
MPCPDVNTCNSAKRATRAYGAGGVGEAGEETVRRCPLPRPTGSGLLEGQPREVGMSYRAGSSSPRSRHRRSSRKSKERRRKARITATAARRITCPLGDQRVEKQQRQASVRNPSTGLRGLAVTPGQSPTFSAATGRLHVRRRVRRRVRWARRRMGRAAPWFLGIVLTVGVVFLVARPGG